MSEMVERVAKKLADYHNADQWEFYVGEARASIEAMREPTEEMIIASDREWDGRMSHRSSGAWQAMIDVALAEHAEKVTE